MNSVRKVDVSFDYMGQGTTEKIVYVFHFDKMLSGLGIPGSPIACKLYKLSTGEDVSGTSLFGVSNLVNFEFSTPIVQLLQKDIMYRLVPEVSIGTQVFSSYVDILGEL